MLFEERDTEAVKAFVAKALEPISDADSDVLADYVLALLKHDMPTEQVRDLCYSQLDDFLGSETHAFVDKVMEALESGSYLAPTQETVETSKKRPVEDTEPEMEDMDQKATAWEPNKQARVDGPGATTRRARDWNAPTDQNAGQQKAKPCFDYMNKGFCARGDRCKYSHTPLMGMPPFPQMPFSPDMMPPDAVKMMMEMPLGAYQPPHNGVGGAFRGRGGGRGGSNNIRHASGGKDEYQRGPSYDKSNTTLHVENIPEENLSEQSIREYFSSFGEITAIKLDLPRRRCKITFATWDQADSVYKSPTPIFNNRFVKVFWAKSLAKAPEPEPQINMDEFQKEIEAKQKLHEERMKQKGAHQKALDELEKQKKMLLERQMEAQKALMQSLGSSAQGDGSREKALEAQLAALKAEASQLGVQVSEAQPSVRGRGGYRGRGIVRGAPFRGRGRGGYGAPRPMSLDNRPKSILVSEISPEKTESFRQFLFSIGDFESIEDRGADTKAINFKDRKTAEKFFASASGDIANVGKVKVEWIRTQPPVAGAGASTAATAPADGEHGNDDDESEGRWR